jgi:hypothetical protein
MRFAGLQRCRNACMLLYDALCHKITLLAISAEAHPRRVRCSFPGWSHPNLNPLHYPSGIPPSLAEAQPCAGLSFWLCATGAAHQERFQSGDRLRAML